MGTSLAVQWLRLCACPAGAQVQPLVRELRSRMPHIAANKKKFFYGLYFSFSPKKSLLIQGYKDLMLFSFKSSLFKFFFLQIICTFFLFFLNLFIIYYLFLAVLGLRFCARAFSSCGKRGPLFIAMRRPLTVAASLVAEHRLQTRRLSSCGSRA